MALISAGKRTRSSSEVLANGEAYSLRILDNSGHDISEEVILLWQKANGAYNVDGIGLFETGDSVLLFENAPEFNELMNYYEVVDTIFSDKGRAQLEQTKLGGPYTLIQKRDGKVYRMGSWKTGYSYADALEGIQVKFHATGSQLVLSVQYRTKRE